MAHIRRHPVDNSKWQARYIDPTGRERSKTFSRKVDAERFLVQVEAQKQRGEWINPELSATRFGDWAQQWFETRSHLKPKTIAGYDSLLRVWILPRFGQVRMDRIDLIAVDTWVAEMRSHGLSASRIRQAHQLLGAILKAAVQNRYLSYNPAAGASLPRIPQQEQLYLTADELEDLAQATIEPYDTLIYLFGYGGLRWGEAAALRRRRISLTDSRVEIAESVAEISGRLVYGSTKSHRTRTISIPPLLTDWLATHLATHVDPDPDALVFTSLGRTYKTKTINAGTPLRSSNFTKKVWQPAVEASGVPRELRIHDLRHTAAALMIAEGAHPEHIKRHLGHSSIVVTMDLYGHLFPSEADAISQRLDRTLRKNRTDKRRTKAPETEPEDELSDWVEGADQQLRLWARQDLNLQPADYESAALARLSYEPQSPIVPGGPPRSGAPDYGLKASQRGVS